MNMDLAGASRDRCRRFLWSCTETCEVL